MSLRCSRQLKSFQAQKYTVRKGAQLFSSIFIRSDLLGFKYTCISQPHLGNRYAAETACTSVCLLPLGAPHNKNRCKHIQRTLCHITLQELLSFKYWTQLSSSSQSILFKAFPEHQSHTPH